MNPPITFPGFEQVPLKVSDLSTLLFDQLQDSRQISEKRLIFRFKGVIWSEKFNYICTVFQELFCCGGYFSIHQVPKNV